MAVTARGAVCMDAQLLAAGLRWPYRAVSEFLQVSRHTRGRNPKRLRKGQWASSARIVFTQVVGRNRGSLAVAQGHFDQKFIVTLRKFPQAIFGRQAFFCDRPGYLRSPRLFAVAQAICGRAQAICGRPRPSRS